MPAQPRPDRKKSKDNKRKKKQTESEENNNASSCKTWATTSRKGSSDYKVIRANGKQRQQPHRFTHEAFDRDTQKHKFNHFVASPAKASRVCLQPSFPHLS